MRARIGAALAAIVAAGTVAGTQHVSSSAQPPSQIPRFCADTLRDQVNGACLSASSVPSLGALYPLSNNFFVDPLTGGVGLGTTNPLGRLHVAGDAIVNGDLRFSGVADGIGFSSFNPAFETSVPMLTMFNSGISNPDRMVLGHSPSFPNYGLAYRDSTDTFAFQSSPSNAVLTVDLNDNLLEVDGVLDAEFASPNSVIGGVNTALYGLGVYGRGFIGVVGEASSSGGFGLVAYGDIGATGTKSFVQPHPFDPALELRYVALEGNEAGTYFRGTARLIGGVAVIEVPEDFRMVTEAAGMTVQVTPLGDVRTWIEERSLERIVVRGHGDVEFDYLVNGVRLGYADHAAIGVNRMFVPQVRGEVFRPEMPDAVRNLMVASGLLNADYTPNEATAARLGWALVDRSEPASVDRHR